MKSRSSRDKEDILKVKEDKYRDKRGQLEEALKRVEDIIVVGLETCPYIRY
jgi:hypothetical protein